MRDTLHKMIPSKKKLRGFLCSRRRRVMVTAMETFNGIPMEQKTILTMTDAMLMLIGL